MEEDNTGESGTEEIAGKTRVVYFYASGNTERVVEVIAEITGASCLNWCRWKLIQMKIWIGRIITAV